MKMLCLSVLFLVLGLTACRNDDGLWANTSSSEYASYCTIEFCDQIETSVKPECTCPCNDDSCTGSDCDGGGGGGGDGSGSGGGGGGGSGSGSCDGSGCGCTLTQGYWKNHNEFRTQTSQRIDWPAPLDESQLLCGRKLLDILNTTPKGEAWYILAHQYIAASLNVAAGADGGDIASALTQANVILTANCSGITTDRQKAIDLSYLLDSYNNGLIGPGHCGG
jgi:hypothetical protein